MDLFLHVAQTLGFESDRQVARLADATPESVSNWRAGSVKSFKVQTLERVKAQVGAHLDLLRGARRAAEHGLHPVEIEAGSSPSDLHRQFRHRVVYDYLGHRFLYFEAQGALAWENLIRQGYGQDHWLDGVRACAQAWLDPTRDGKGRCKGPLAQGLGLAPRERLRGLDLIGLGPGDGAKEQAILQQVLAAESERRLPWLTYQPVDVSISLLLQAAARARETMARDPWRSVVPICADFEEGPLHFLRRLPTSRRGLSEGPRLVCLLGNIFGNLRDEESFVRGKLHALARPGDFVWLEVGLRHDPIENEPLYALTQPERKPTAGEANRRLLLLGPYRRWEAALGRRPAEVEMRVWLRENDEASRVPGSCNFCHDLLISAEGRVCTMLYSRRYALEDLRAWLERHGFAVLRTRRISDRRTRVAHLLLQRKEA